MATVEQPLKKRKVEEQPAEPPGQNLHQSLGVGALSQDEILRKRRNKDEIRSVYDSYRRIRVFVSHKDPHLSPELEQAYLSLITASRGCTSVQRIVAELIPRYASYCPTALEAAVKVVINMYKWSSSIITRGEDSDGIAFQTAQACIFGLVDICCTASLEAPTSSVIRGICSTVFLSVFTFLISSFEGKPIFQIVGREVLKMQESPELFSELKQKFEVEDESPLLKLSKFSGLSLLRVFFQCPRNSLAACFELFNSTGTGVSKEGQYFLSQVTNTLGAEEGNEVISKGLESDVGQAPEEASHVTRNCLLGLVLGKDSSLRGWIFSQYKKLRKSASPEAVLQVTSALEVIFKSFTELVEVETSQVYSEEDHSDPSKYINRQYLVPRISSKREASSEIIGKDSKSRGQDAPVDDISTEKISGQYRKLQSPVSHMDMNSSHDVGAHVNLRRVRSMPRDVLNNQLLSPMTRKTLDFRANSFEGRNHLVQVENQISNPDFSLPSALESPKNQIVWYSDGDPAAVDIFSASKQLWLGSLGPDATESLIRFQFERFGSVEQLFFFPNRGFALIEYRNIMDAINAREYMRGYTAWGSCLRIKFLDKGLGTRGAINGVAVGSSCHVYVGNVLSQWVKDEVMHETMKVVFKGPRMVADLTREGALLMEFETPEEAASVMERLRQHREENSMLNMGLGPNSLARAHMDGGRSLPIPLHVDVRNNNAGSNNIIGSPHAQSMINSPADYSRMRNRSSQLGNLHATAYAMNSESSSLELVSPRINLENHAAPFQPKWTTSGSDMSEVGPRNFDGYDNNMAVDPSQGVNRGPGATEQMWSYNQPEMELSGPGITTATHGPLIAPMHNIQASPFMRPGYRPPGASWDPRGLNPHFALNPVSPVVMPSNLHSSAVAAPFLPASVTPLAQMPGSSMQHFEQMVLAPPIIQPPPPLLSVPPPLPEMPPPLPPSPPPPPPSSPPPPPTNGPSDLEASGQTIQYQWQGTLCKSGVLYCTINAHRADSDICKYSSGVSEPAGWPAKLDMTKRTDFKHVKSTFASTPPQRREVCRLLPASSGDHKGFQEFITYLKQRGCAGVIKIPAVSSISMWSRLLFILPYSVDACTTLSISPNPSDCLIAVLLPKETTLDWV